MWQAWINILASIWAIISGFAFIINPTNFFITGAVIAVFGFWSPNHKWQGTVDGILGLWLILSSFIPALWSPINIGAVGFVVLVLAAWRAFETRVGQRAEVHAHQPGGPRQAR